MQRPLGARYFMNSRDMALSNTHLPDWQLEKFESVDDCRDVAVATFRNVP
jgi:hypothetical protein